MISLTPPPRAHRLGLLVLALAAAWPIGARAYRPFDGTDAAVASKGEAEVELGPVGYLAEGRDRDLVVPRLILNWGFADRWEAVLEGAHFVELGHDVEGPRNRIEDAAFSLKGVLREGSLQEGSGPSVATELSALLPTGEGVAGTGAEWAFIVSQRWRDLTVHVNGAAAWTRAHVPGVFAGIILEGHDAWAVRPVAELFVEHERDQPTTWSGLLGSIWRLDDRFALDAAVRRARAGSVDVTEVRLGLTWGFNVGFPR